MFRYIGDCVSEESRVSPHVLLARLHLDLGHLVLPQTRDMEAAAICVDGGVSFESRITSIEYISMAWA